MQKEMERFKEASADEFAPIPATPRPKPAETVTTGEVSQSPVKTRKTAACGNCKVLRYSLCNCIEQTYMILRKGIFTRKQAPKKLNFWNWLDATSIEIHFLIKVALPMLTGNIDCFEIFLEAPSNLKSRAQVWSSYKRHTTMTFLISCNTLGAINFLSRVWGDDTVTSSLSTRGNFRPSFHTILGTKYWQTGVSQ